jgi:hypothetical protein
MNADAVAGRRRYSRGDLGYNIVDDVEPQQKPETSKLLIKTNKFASIVSAAASQVIPAVATTATAQVSFQPWETTIIVAMFLSTLLLLVMLFMCGMYHIIKNI